MAEYNYSVKGLDPEHSAHAVGRNLNISTKQSVEISKFIRNKNLQRAKTMLKEVMGMKLAVPFTRFNTDVGHKTKIGPGRYPIKACTILLALLDSVENNAQVKGLNTGDLILKHIIPQKAAQEYRHGRRYGRRMKRTHVEVVVEEKKND